MQHVDDIETFIVKDLMARPRAPEPDPRASAPSRRCGPESGLKALAIGCTRSQDKSQAATRLICVHERVVEMLRSILLVDANDMGRFEAPRTPPTSASLRGRPSPSWSGPTPSFVQPDLFVSSLLVIDSPAEMIGKFEHGIIKHGLPQNLCTARSVCRRSPLDHEKPPPML